MASIDTLRQDAASSRATNESGSPAGPALGSPPGAAPSPANGPALAAFRAGRSEVERTTDLLAFAIAVERGLAATPDAVERARREADAALGDHSLRYLHNNVEQIRQEAVAAHLGGLPRPPGLLKLFFANLAAIAAAVAIAGAAWTRPEVRAFVSGLLGA